MKKLVLVLLALLLLTGCGAKTVEIDGISYDLESTAITLPQGTSIDHYEAVKAALPNCEISWLVPFQDSYLDPNTDRITVNSLTEEDVALLSYFPNLKTLDAGGCADPSVAFRLQQENEDLKVIYNVNICGKTYPYNTVKLSLKEPEVSQLEGLKMLPNLKSVRLTEPQGDPAALLALAETIPMTWTKTAFGREFPSDVTEMDFSEDGLAFEDAQAMEAELAWFPNLDLVFFGDVTADNDAMAAYRERQAENYKVAWNIHLNHRVTIRSDIEYFMPYQLYMNPVDKDLVNLKYCNDVLCVDVGHMRNITHCEWIAYMPKLKYVILADSNITDISPLAGLKNLVFLELFKTNIMDYSPLLTCTALEDLNLCYSHGDPAPIAQMTWLKRLWWAGSREAEKLLPETLTETELEFYSGSSTGGTWRQGQHYYDMRDLLGMPYLWG